MKVWNVFLSLEMAMLVMGTTTPNGKKMQHQSIEEMNG
jgi:hypothetical protein